MTLELTPQTIAAAAVLLAAFILPKIAPFLKSFAKGLRWFDKQEQQSTNIDKLRDQHDQDVEAIKKEFSDKMRAVNEEQTILTYGILACLKGLQEKGCNGPVTEAINVIEKHLNKKAHDL